MGKKLGDEVFDNAVEEVDVEPGDPLDYMIDVSSGKWYVHDTYKGKVFPISQYRGWKFKIGNFYSDAINKWFYRFAFLTDDNHTSATSGHPVAANFSATSPYNDLVSVNSADDSDQWKEGVVPNDAHFLYVYTHNSTAAITDFYPEVFFTNPNPSSRIDRLVDVAEGVPSIKQDWFAVSGGPYDYDIPLGMLGKNQSINPSTGNFTVDDSNVGTLIPKVIGLANGVAYTPTVNECFAVEDLPNKLLTLTFEQLTGSARWAAYVVLYGSDFAFIERSSVIYFSSSNDFTGTYDFSEKTNCKYFKLVVYHQSNGSTSDNPANVTFEEGFCSFVRTAVAQESMPNRVGALESRVAEIGGNAVSKFSFCSYNIGHFSLGKDYDTFISDQKADLDYTNYGNSTPYSNYAAQLARWRQMLNEYSPDIIAMCEYITTFAHNQGGDVLTASAIFGRYPYSRVGKLPSSTSYIRSAVFANMVLGTSSDVDFGYESRYYQCVDVNMGGTPVKVVVTHLSFSDSEERAAQMRTLISAFADVTHVIICGDFNNPDPDEFDVFVQAGYTMANHDYLGNINTYPSSGTEVWSGDTKTPYEHPTKAIDNIMVKGFAMSNVRIIDRCDLTDHCGVICDLTLI